METKTRKVRTVCFYGAKNGNAKLTARQVRRIRNLYATGNETCRSLAPLQVGRLMLPEVYCRAKRRHCPLQRRATET
jgi:hypothetical protein